MLHRRGTSPVMPLFQLPWLVPGVLGTIVWLAAPFIVAKLVHSSPFLADSQSGLLHLIHVFAGMCFLAAAVSFVRRLIFKRKFDRQRSLHDLRNLTWQEFESIVGEAFRRQGYAVTETGQAGPDGGVDLVLARDGQRYLVQCKQYRTWRVSVTIVREIFGVVAARKADGAIVVTTGTFTNDAVDFARGQPIELIDGRRLEAMIREINVGREPLSGSGTRREPTIDGESWPAADAAREPRSPSSSKFMTVVVKLSNPTTNETKTFRLDIRPNGSEEVGHREGWVLATGDEVTVSNDAYSSWNGIIN